MAMSMLGTSAALGVTIEALPFVRACSPKWVYQTSDCGGIGEGNPIRTRSQAGDA